MCIGEKSDWIGIGYVISRSPSSSSGTPLWEQQSAASKHPELRCRIDQTGTEGWNRWLCEREPIRP
jgi:hypothetical protein